MKIFEYNADMGSLKIMSKNMSCFFSNGFGDGCFNAIVYEKEDKLPNNLDFIGHFTCNGGCYLMSYDCAEFEEIYKLHRFKKGRWFVYRDKNHIIHIKFCDHELHS